ncbi:MAG: 5'/3'-nucleotidase SurE [Pseudomonadota bacterium]
MRILLTNDDGINAPGLEVLERIARQFSDDVWTVAPETDQSGVGHAMTLSAPMRLRKVGDQKFALTGTPTDCVIMAVREVLDRKPDLILSGVNAGQNIGDHVLYSGTVAGAMEGAFLGIPAMALSQAFDFGGSRTVPWNTVETAASEAISKVLAANLPADVFVNINFPNCAPEEIVETVVVSQGKFEHGLFIDKRRDGRGVSYYWLTFGGPPPDVKPETDVEALRDNKIAVSPLKLDLTEERCMAALKSSFSS